MLQAQSVQVRKTALHRRAGHSNPDRSTQNGKIRQDRCRRGALRRDFGGFEGDKPLDASEIKGAIFCPETGSVVVLITEQAILHGENAELFPDGIECRQSIVGREPQQPFFILFHAEDNIVRQTVRLVVALEVV